jgi:hypothetical protein
MISAIFSNTSCLILWNSIATVVRVKVLTEGVTTVFDSFLDTDGLLAKGLANSEGTSLKAEAPADINLANPHVRVVRRRRIGQVSARRRLVMTGGHLHRQRLVRTPDIIFIPPCVKGALCRFVT